ncbi:MAG: glycosyl transferase family 2 [Acidimicrobiales bacterium]|nr:glycosyl transferase family 2 [Acidimicrobiales bacterium]
MDAVSPLVTVAVPTFQRPDSLRRAIDSVLAQDHPAVEIIISDNASADGTEAVCREYAEREPSITYLRRPVNVGATANFDGLRSEGSGDYFVFLADDDWMSPGYLSTCVTALEADPGLAVAAGRAVYHHPDRVEPEPQPINLDAETGADRVCDYYRTVRANGVFYGVARAAVNGRIGPLRNCQGADMVHVAAMAYQGRVTTFDHIAVNRTVGGATANLANVARSLGLGRFETYLPQLAIVWWVFRDIAWDSPVYADRGRWGRLALALRAAWVIFWHFVPGAAVKLGRLVVASLRRRFGRAPRRPDAAPALSYEDR